MRTASLGEAAGLGASGFGGEGQGEVFVTERDVAVDQGWVLADSRSRKGPEEVRFLVWAVPSCVLPQALG
eukprot:gene13706-biopygen514